MQEIERELAELRHKVRKGDMELSGAGNSTSVRTALVGKKRPKTAVMGDKNSKTALVGYKHPKTAVVGDKHPKTAVVGDKHPKTAVVGEKSINETGERDIAGKLISQKQKDKQAGVITEKYSGLRIKLACISYSNCTYVHKICMYAIYIRI